MLIPELAQLSDLSLFRGDDGQGGYYDALYMAGCFVVATTNGGAWGLT